MAKAMYDPWSKIVTKNDVETLQILEFDDFILGCVSKVEPMTAERKNLQNQKEIRAECRIFLYTK